MSSTTSNEGPSTSGVASQTASGVLSGSGVLNARPGSTTSSGLLSQMVSSFSADVAREYLEKVADLLLEFAQADSIVKSYMCSQSLLGRLFQMFNRIEPPILIKVHFIIVYLASTSIYLLILIPSCGLILILTYVDSEMYQSFVNRSELSRKSSACRCNQTFDSKS